MKKKIDQVVDNMTNVTFEEEMKLLLEMEEKFPYTNEMPKKSNKKKIAIVYDIEGWAFCNIAKQIKTYLSADFEIDIFPVSVFDDNVVKLVLLASNYDLVHCLWRGLLSCIDYEFARGYIHN